MGKLKKNSIWYDSLILLILFVIAGFTITYLDISFNFDFKAVGGIIVGLFGTLLGFVITAFTILFMFDTDKNNTLIKIKKAGLFNQIYERFITTMIVTFIALIYTLGYLFISGIYENVFLLNFLLIYLCFLSFLRVYRVLKILYLVHQTLL